MSHSESTSVDLVRGDEERVPPTTPAGAGGKKGLRFWLVLSALLLSAFLAVLEAYAISTALPTIVSDLHASDFVWVASAYGIASTALLPLSGGLAEVFGRRPVALGCLFLFALGGALAGASQSMNMLIAARVVQGAGAGGILTLSQIILSDLVTLQERGTYNGLFGLTWALGGGIGPVVGGALSHHTTWRWLFYLNVPACAIVAIFMIFALRLNRPPSGKISRMLARLDWVGNTLVIASTCACVIGLTWGGVVFSWHSAQVLTPLILGIVGLVVFFLYEWRVSKHPVVPLYLLANRTSMSGYAQISLAAFVNITLLYYLPVYYQACKDASPTASGVDLFGLCFSTGPVSILVGASIAKLRRYRPQLWLGWCLIIVGLALMSTVSENTSKAASVGYQVVTGCGIGILYSAAYFPVLAALPVTSNSPALALFMFLRTFAQAWGVTIGGAILQNELQGRLPASLKQNLPDLDNIAYAIIPIIPSLQGPSKAIARRAFAESLATVWRVLIAVSGVGLLASLPMRGLPLHAMKDENWAMRGTERKVEGEPDEDG
ncbi:Mfs1.2 [Punctularia strigosozonata HHB-11173 SS5]|uniref:Mfs1.2 n=1 Tax=Punctularia strigosozonata (strain HHB-11173) TaxID=741275 RepID=UPI00044164E1|nr:Mfs1.2 [Punctularia strigosozonata HHB-11173 SS5]EIN09177.1 Mfs1.2 [Punctularia strigosozonata HHB-11173 SS5]